MRVAFRILLLGTVLCACTDPSPPEQSLSDSVPEPGREDLALRFDGVDDYLTFGTARIPLPISAHTLSLWVRPAALGREMALVTLRREDSGEEFRLSAQGAPVLARIWGPETMVEAEGTLEAGRWHHLAYVYDTVTHSLFVDGVLVGSGSASPNNHSPTSGWLGTVDGALRPYAGELDEFRIWNVARTREELENEIRNRGVLSAPELVITLGFDEMEGVTAFDRSGNGNHATLGDGVALAMPERVLAERP